MSLELTQTFPLLNTQQLGHWINSKPTLYNAVLVTETFPLLNTQQLGHWID